MNKTLATELYVVTVNSCWKNKNQKASLKHVHKL